jgi:hypothetical protein
MVVVVCSETHQSGVAGGNGVAAELTGGTPLDSGRSLTRRGVQHD